MIFTSWPLPRYWRPTSLSFAAVRLAGLGLGRSEMARGLHRPGGMPRARSAARVVAVCLAAIVGLFVAPGPFAPLAARATPVIIQVTTTSDEEFPADGMCSLRAAILAANGTNAGYCGTGTAEQDSIRFNIGSGVPVINVGSLLPAITDPVTIRGNTGGATRVELRGPHSVPGLSVVGGADGSSIESLVVDNFGGGIEVDASGVTIAGNIIGPNDLYGIYAPGGGVIGGTTGVTPGGPCTGDCNLISGNGSYGLYLASGGTVQGNFIGTTASGGAANANQYGIVVSSGVWIIGGALTGAGNVVSGNTSQGLDLHGCSNCAIQGNFIGTNAIGTAALANGSAGVSLDGGGGTTTVSGNVISGNLGNGIELHETPNVTFQGNRIGTKVGGAALGNGGDGVLLSGGCCGGVESSRIGSATDAAAANVIAYNTGVGIRLLGSLTKYNEMRGNSIHDNGGAGIALESGANEFIAAPSITGVSPIGGTACAGCAVDIYSDSADEGRVFEGSVTANGTGQWSYPSSVSGPKVTATNTDALHNTSEFSAPVSAVTRQPDGRIRKGSGAFVGNNIYNTDGTGQTRTGSAARGSTITFGISIQNDGKVSDLFKLAATGAATTMYRVRYFRGTTEITAAVVAGTYQTPSLAPGAKYLITAKVKVKSSATVGSSVTRLMTISSVADPAKVDAVRFIGKRG